jgi:outer membrane protein assembly factor BamE (lipoprotein component of BamABCDE complex)
MRRLNLSLILIWLLLSCAGSPARTGWEAEQNRANLLKLNLGMTKDQVLTVMGPPYKTEMYQVGEKPTEFWLYLTEGKSVSDRKLSDSNFTPLAFENGILKGWGRNYYDNELKIRK